jgi:Ca2+-transporting ATPase
MVVILAVAAVVSALLGDHVDAIAIAAILALNIALGFRQEYRAERAMAALRRLAVPGVRVLREGAVREISALELVPGDVVLVEAGNLVPADCRVVEAVHLRVEEAALTGESVPEDKSPEPLEDVKEPLGDRTNMLYMGTLVTQGRGRSLVVATGMHTELGNIARMLQGVEDEQTPLQRRLNQLGRWLALAALGLVGIVFAAGLARGEELRIMFLTAVSLAVAAVPEGLPAVVTITLSLGAQRMLKRRALIRRLPAVETLGSVTVICSDKTGTLTANEMAVAVMQVAGRRLDFEEGQTDVDWKGVLVPGRPADGPGRAMALLLAAGALCNDAALEVRADPADEADRISAVGDPTEGALVVAATLAGTGKAELDARFLRVGELPFDSTRKRMTTVHEVPADTGEVPPALAEGVAAVLAATLSDPDAVAPSGPQGAADAGRFVAFVKGAVDGLVEQSALVWGIDGPEPLDAKWRSRILEANDALAVEGMRVLGAAARGVVSVPDGIDDAEGVEVGLVFLGLFGMIDPARPEAAEAVAVCKSAGIRPVMITGDHPLTALAIARTLGIESEGAVTGRELAEMAPEELSDVVQRVSVYARVAPEQKLSLVQALQESGEVVSMTGDGVNDAPALRKADIGVAMGITGTDVSKEASDMVLLDDNFATIVAAVKQGRVIFDNIKKFLRYILSSNTGELAVMLVAPFLGMPLPLLPLQILWINLVTDGLPALALSLEPEEKDVMQRPPQPPSRGIFADRLGVHVLLAGLLMAAAALGLGYWYWRSGSEAWQTMVFTNITLSQLGLALAVRSPHELLVSRGLWGNPALLASIAATFLLQMGVVYLPFMQGIFRTVPLSARDLLICIAFSSVVFIGMELQKLVFGRRGGRERRSEA